MGEVDDGGVWVGRQRIGGRVDFLDCGGGIGSDDHRRIVSALQCHESMVTRPVLRSGEIGRAIVTDEMDADAVVVGVRDGQSAAVGVARVDRGGRVDVAVDRSDVDLVQHRQHMADAANRSRIVFTKTLGVHYRSHMQWRRWQVTR